MSATVGATQVRLHRDALNTPWGFRLQGGKDFKTPLSVQRVFVGSPADGDLHRGDVILGIDSYDASQLTHKQAQDIIKAAGSVLSLRIRGGGSRSAPPQSQQAYKPPTQSYGTDYSQPQRGGYPMARPSPHQKEQGMIGRLQTSLNHAIWQPGQDYDQGESSKGQFYSNRWTRPDPHKTGSLPKSLTEPGWTPGMGKQQSSAYRPVRGPGGPSTGAFNPVNRPVPVNRPQPVSEHRPSPHRQQPPRHLNAESPAWAGTLRSSGGPKPWEFREAEAIAPGSAGPMPHQEREPIRAQSLPGPSPSQVQPHQPRVQNMHYGVDGGQRYEQHDPSDAGAHPDAKVVHMQYNSPLGLYSKQSVEEAIGGQTTGRPGEGTIGVTSTGPGKNFDPSRSEVLRFLAEEGQAGAPRGGQQFGGYHQEQYQSPAMHALESRYGGEETVGGTSDF